MYVQLIAPHRWVLTTQLNHLASLAKLLSDRLQTKWLRVRVLCARAASCHPALKGNCYTLQLNVLVLSTQWIVCYCSVLRGVWLQDTTIFYSIINRKDILRDAIATRKVRHKSMDLKSVQKNVIKSVIRITTSGGCITRLTDSV